jgi:hypothetical protein
MCSSHPTKIKCNTLVPARSLKLNVICDLRYTSCHNSMIIVKCSRKYLRITHIFHNSTVVYHVMVERERRETEREIKKEEWAVMSPNCTTHFKKKPNKPLFHFFGGKKHVFSKFGCKSAINCANCRQRLLNHPVVANILEQIVMRKIQGE